MSSRHMNLAGFLIAGPVAHSHALWRNPSHEVPFLTTEYYVEVARKLEQGKFDLIFFADRLAIADRYGNDKEVGIRHGDQDSTRMDPVPILGALAATTRHIGLGATRSTTYDQPYHLAREFRTIDHLSNGRAAWNVVTSMNDGEAMNFGVESHLSHDQRYDRAEEFMELIFKLWDSWEEGALRLDRGKGIYADPAKVHYVNHDGAYFKSRGPLNIPAGPQGRPVIIQAGASDRGRAFAVKWAEVIFNISPTREHMKRSTLGVREETERLKRPAGSCKSLTAIMPFVGRTREEAQEKRDLANSLVDPMVGLSTLAAHSNVDLSMLDLDAPVEQLQSSGTQSLIAMASRIAKDNSLSLREIGRKYGESVLVPQLCGTAGQIADELADIFTSGDADGFVVSPAFLPDSFAEFADGVVPELQRLGVFRKDYTAATLRGHLHT
ncbi:LLM class flavin-dependent oxidoreductase [Bradyrhizobium erythrophlei]|uniref:Dibenzothiophene-5,5-dioxide monooxygenase n=1 Tax=Bradyrhizobium erythrophlei TaxID=1437360 RepID=A0A1M7UVL4_9BRAD|nr:LLM class flavin-dependent oxidoreductase [Bradyrhizobium erythrophlei]SHN86988.1 dibenzothiophene-5,5-dioxide monooxygenase [Bradyrhizobium erythrophlei]